MRNVTVMVLLAAAAGAGCNRAQAEGPIRAWRLTGPDLYRLNCQACHGPEGVGTAQAPSLTKMVKSLASGNGEDDLKRRLTRGGERMPALPHLTDPEIEELLGYLRELGGGATSSAPAVLTISGPALGERIYRSNCATCHERERGAAPGMMCRPESLAGATARFSKHQVMNLLDVGVGPMPAFRHLMADERDALWAYLATLPASPGAGATMGEMCPMVRAAMEGRPMGGMMGHGGMMGMMGGGMGCPMMRSTGDAPSKDAPNSDSRLPPCCRGRR